MTSEIRANTLKNRVGLGTIEYTNTGPVVSGIVTANGLELNSVDTGSSAGPELKLFRNSASPADADYLGQLKFVGESDTGVERNYAKITGKILDASNGTEDGILEFAHIKGGSQTITGRWRSDSLQLLNSTNLTVDGDLDIDGHTNLDNVSIAGVTTISGDLTISSTSPVLKLVDSNNNSDFSIYGGSGVFNIYDETNSASRLSIASDGTITAIQGLVCSSTLTIPDSIIHSGDTNTKIRFPGNDAISFETAGDQRLRIYDDGYVIIGSTSRSGTAGAGGLDIQGNSTNCILEMGNPFPNFSGAVVPEFRITATNSGHTVDFESVWGGDNLLHKHLSFAGGVTSIHKGINDDEVARFTSSGTVGIGTVTPESGQLQVIGSGYHQINISGNKTANANKTGGISFLNYEGSRTSVFQTYANTSGNTIYYGSADSSARGVQNHIFYVNSSRTATSNHEEALRIASDGNVHINTVDNGNASAKLNVENSSSVGADVLKIMNKPSGANGKARLVFHTETSQGQGCQPYIQSLSGTDAGPNASDGHNAGGLEFHTRSGGAGTDNNAMRIRDDGTVEKYGSVGQILLKPSGAEIEFTRGASSNILCSNSAGYLNIYTGGHTTYPAMRIFASAGANSSGAKVGINTDSIGVDTQMSIMAPPGYPALYSSYGMRIMPNGSNSFGYAGQYITRSSGVYVIHMTIPANNTWTQVAAGRYHGATVTARIGDASSKRTIFANYDFTAPNYGVASFNEIANTGGWNTGSASMRIANASTNDYAIEVQHNSYYNTSNNSSVHLIFNVC